MHPGDQITNQIEPAQPELIRLDRFLANNYPDYSRSTWQKYIKLGCVKVNDEVQTSPKREVDPSAEIMFVIPDDIQHDDIHLPIIYEDNNVIVIDKPTGVLTHSKGELNDEPTVASYLAPKTTYKSATNRPGIIHRLDRDTSGLMIIARNDATATLLGRQFSERKVKKTYLAVVEGTPKQIEAHIDLPLARNPKEPSRFRVAAEGKPAQTNYKVLASNGKRSLMLLNPKTGRTHQLRVHMQYIGCPIVGDRFYGSAKPGKRLMLHAYKLEITIPDSDRRVFSSHIPDDFKRLFPEACSELAR